MFRSARIKLTVFYVLAIMLISILFSSSFYFLATREVTRVVKLRETRVNHLLLDPLDRPLPPFPSGMIQDLEDSASRLRLTLVMLNGGIFLLAIGSGYFLSGRTLGPIKEMVD